MLLTYFIAEYLYFYYRLAGSGARTMVLYFLGGVINSLRVNVAVYFLYMILVWIPLKANCGLHT